jgi:hypothetical protein
MGEEGLTVECELGSPGCAGEQLHLQILLEDSDPLGDRLLGDRQLRRRLLELPGVGHRDEGANRFDVHPSVLHDNQWLFDDQHSGGHTGLRWLSCEEEDKQELL